MHDSISEGSVLQHKAGTGLYFNLQPSKVRSTRNCYENIPDVRSSTMGYFNITLRLRRFVL